MPILNKQHISPKLRRSVKWDEIGVTIVPVESQRAWKAELWYEGYEEWLKCDTCHGRTHRSEEALCGMMRKPRSTFRLLLCKRLYENLSHRRHLEGDHLSLGLVKSYRVLTSRSDGQSLNK